MGTFFFQAEDRIRDHCVTGVQMCALPICGSVDLLFEFVGGTGVINNGVGEVTSGTAV